MLTKDQKKSRLNISKYLLSLCEYDPQEFMRRAVTQDKTSVHHFEITKSYLYNYDPLKPPFYIVKLGFTGVYIIFLISAQNIDCGYSLEPPRLGEAVLTSTHMLCFE